MLWSDRAHFYVRGGINTHNCRIWADTNSHVGLQIILHSPKVTVWCEFIGSFTVGPYFYEKANPIVLVTFSVISDRCRGRDVLSQHFIDVRVIIRAFSLNWPQRSPNLNPCEFWLWGYLKSVMYQGHVSDIHTIIDQITSYARHINADMLRDTVENIVYLM
ncbi:uncharacterized protein NPIL_381531 [Nephila pilipes]|uniref:Uncharacterized protein n=1 Tax=Nephila pilipes TaxID=299642 RepID=A0A8X6TMF2_NEPPI|nr:uncharacterized protein NPIL_381531 [Nephila pilipes]